MNSKSIPKERSSNVLFIPSGSIGDALMMIMLASELQTLNSSLNVTVIARRNAGLIRDLSAAYPFISVVQIEKNSTGIQTLLFESLRRPYTVLMPAVFAPGRIVSLKNLFRLLRVRPGTYTAGLIRDHESVPYHEVVPYDATLLHFDNMRRMASAAGLKVQKVGSPIPQLRITHSIGKSVLPSQPYIVIHPFGSSSWKSWPPRRTRELIQHLQKSYPAYSFVITGGPENADSAATITKGLEKTISSTGTPILEVANLLKSAELYIGVDTGITHLACLLHVRSILLEHNASPEWSPRYNPNATILTTTQYCVCHGRKNDQCKVIDEGVPYLRCLYEISDQMILSSVDESLAHERTDTIKSI